MTTAPAEVRFCLRCAGPMATRTVHGVSRRVCERCAYVHYADPKLAVGVAVFRDQRLLLVRRVMNPGRGLWALPGGYLNAGEDPRDAAAREVAEEASIEVTVTGVVDVFANSAADGGAVFVLFAATWRDGEPTPGDDADDARFFGRDELPELAFASTHHVVTLWPADPPATHP